MRKKDFSLESLHVSQDSAKCPICGKLYKDSKSETKVIRREGPLFLVHTTCKNCGTSVLGNIVTFDNVVGSVGVLTDLTFADTLYFRRAKRIKVDDVIDLHRKLERD
ncbi:hypothetical protein COY23_02535 [bacterium (Candidatus Torokbacteria) CG_4_10_14_0_2_um_filter_35_8]|nr:MAG: hypothetical protein COY23_02535 [bacterium (Candidatus Torokbacteria) CG_4_10_14_0_2_um_filter_35_8]